MYEDALINYGVLGLWTATLLVERYKFMDKLSKIIRENTLALNIINSKIR